MTKDAPLKTEETKKNSSIDYSDLLSLAVDTAKLAGKFLLENDSLVIKKSNDRDTKLEADIESEKIIMGKLSAHYPILSEEYGGSISQNGPSWIIDPLDGTVNYSKGIPLNCVSIALWNNGPVLGVIYDFKRNELFSGGVGINAKLNGESIKVSDITSRNQAIIFTGFPTANSFKTDSLLQFVSTLQRYKKVRLIGSASLSLAWVAAGRGEVYMEEKIRLWDVAAGLAILNSAGGSFQILGEDPINVYADNGVLIGVDD